MDISLPTGINANTDDLRAVSVFFSILLRMLGFCYCIILQTKLFLFILICHFHRIIPNILSKPIIYPRVDSAKWSEGTYLYGTKNVSVCANMFQLFQEGELLFNFFDRGLHHHDLTSHRWVNAFKQKDNSIKFKLCSFFLSLWKGWTNY